MQCIEVKKNADNDNKNIIIIFERGFNSQYVLMETRPEGVRYLEVSSNVNEVIRVVLNSFFTKRFCTHQRHQKHQEHQKYQKHKDATKQKYKTLQTNSKGMVVKLHQ